MRKCQGRLQNESLRKQVLLGLNVFKDVCSIRANEFMGKTSSWRTPRRGVRGWSITPPTLQTWPGYPVWLPMMWAAWISEALALPLPLWATLMLSVWSPCPAKDPRGWVYGFHGKGIHLFVRITVQRIRFRWYNKSIMKFTLHPIGNKSDMKNDKKKTLVPVRC